MGTTRGSTPGNESGRRPGSERTTRPAASMLLALAMAFAGCTTGDPPRSTHGAGGAGEGGEGGAGDTGGKGGADDTGGKGGNGGGTGGGGGGTGGSAGKDAAVAPAEDSGATEDPVDAAAGTTEDTASAPPADGPPAVMRPDAMGQACKTGQNYNFTITA